MNGHTLRNSIATAKLELDQAKRVFTQTENGSDVLTEGLTNEQRAQIHTAYDNALTRLRQAEQNVIDLELQQQAHNLKVKVEMGSGEKAKSLAELIKLQGVLERMLVIHRRPIREEREIPGYGATSGPSQTSVPGTTPEKRDKAALEALGELNRVRGLIAYGNSLDL